MRVPVLTAHSSCNKREPVVLTDGRGASFGFLGQDSKTFLATKHAAWTFVGTRNLIWFYPRFPSIYTIFYTRLCISFRSRLLYCLSYCVVRENVERSLFS